MCKKASAVYHEHLFSARAQEPVNQRIDVGDRRLDLGIDCLLPLLEVTPQTLVIDRQLAQRLAEDGAPPPHVTLETLQIQNPLIVDRHRYHSSWSSYSSRSGR